MGLCFNKTLFKEKLVGDCLGSKGCNLLTLALQSWNLMVGKENKHCEVQGTNNLLPIFLTECPNQEASSYSAYWRPQNPSQHRVVDQVGLVYKVMSIIPPELVQSPQLLKEKSEASDSMTMHIEVF